MVSLLCLISQRSQVQEGKHPSMWAISLGRPVTEIAYFERMGLDGFSSNSLVLIREQAFRGRERDSLLVHAYYHTLAHSLFSLSGSFFFSLSFLISLLAFTPFITSFSLLFYFLSFVFFFPFSLFSPILPPLCIVKALFILPVVMGFCCFAP